MQQHINPDPLSEKFTLSLAIRTMVKNGVSGLIASLLLVAASQSQLACMLVRDIACRFDH